MAKGTIRKTTNLPAKPSGWNLSQIPSAPQVPGAPGIRPSAACTYFMPGWIRRDFLPELQGRKLWLVYEQMGSNDAYVGSALNAYSLFIRRTTWHVDPVVDENKDNGSAEFLETLHERHAALLADLHSHRCQALPAVRLCTLREDLQGAKRRAGRRTLHIRI